MAKEKKKSLDEDIVWDETPQVAEEDIIWDEQPKKEPQVSFLDSITRAPVKAVLGELVETENPVKAIIAGAAQFGERNIAPPTMKSILEKAGVSGEQLFEAPKPPSVVIPGLGKVESPYKDFGATDVSVSGALSGPVEEALDPLNYLPAGKIIQAAGKPLRSFANLAKPLEDITEKAARIATGATGKEAAQFAPDLGKKLTEEGFMRFGGGIQGLSERLGAATDALGQRIAALVRVADEAGAAGIRKADLVSDLNKEIKALQRTGAQGDQIRKIEGFLRDIEAMPDVVPLEDVLIGKRAHDISMGGAFDKPLEKEGIRAAGTTYRDALKGGMEKAGKDIGDLRGISDEFSAVNKEYETLIPASKAASKRAGQLAQQTTSLLPGVADFVKTRIPQSVAVGSYQLAKIPKTVEGFMNAIPTLMQKYPTAAPILEGLMKLPASALPKAISGIAQQFPEEFEQTEYPSEFEGKLHTPEDRAVYKQKLDDSLPPRERAKAVAALNKDGSITWRPEQPAPQQAAPVASSSVQQELSLSEMAERAKKTRQF